TKVRVVTHGGLLSKIRMTRKSAIHLGHSVPGEKPGGPAPVAAKLDRRDASRPQRSLLVLASATHPELATNSTHRGCRATSATQATRAETPCWSRGVTLRPRLSGCASPSAQRARLAAIPRGPSWRTS